MREMGICVLPAVAVAVLVSACGSSTASPAGGAAPACKPFTAAVTHSRLTPIAGTNGSRFHIEGVKPVAILGGTDGVWFSEDATHHVGHLTSAGALTEYEVTSLATAALQIAAASDGSLWVPGGSHAALIHLVPGGRSEDCTLPDPTAHPLGVAVTNGGQAWVTESGTAALAILDGKKFSEVHLPKNTVPQELVPAGEGGFWVSDFNGGVLRVTAQGVQATVALPHGANPIGLLAAGGGIYVAEFGNDEVVRIDATGQLGPPLKVPGKATGTQGLAGARDGGVWFTESRVDRVGHITAEGVVRDWAVDGDWPDHVTVDAAGTIWFSEYNSSDIGILQVRL